MCSRIPPLIGHGGCFVLLKNKTMVGLATLALAGGAAMLTMPAANAATMKCGDVCLTLASQKYGTADVLAVGSSSAVGLSAFWYSQSEDFRAQLEGDVYDLNKAGAIPWSEAKTYGFDQVYQYVYWPGGHPSDECVGASAGSTAVTLQPCGATAKTLWVGLSGLQDGNFEPLLSAALSANSAMLLTASSATGALSVSPMDLTTTESNGNATTTTSPYQMWETVEGVYGASSVNCDRG
jgi:hypothetical protein